MQKSVSRYELEMTRPFNVVVFEEDSDIAENAVLDTLKKRYENETLSIMDENENSILISQEFRNAEFNECPYSVFCIAKMRNNRLHSVILHPDMLMLEEEGF